MSRLRWSSALLMLALIATTAPAQGHRHSPHPDSARLITEDIPRFWAVLDRAPADSLPALLERDYLAVGTPGLRAFTRLRIGNAAALSRAVSGRRERYEQIRTSSLDVAAAERAIRASFYALAYLYPDAVFPDVYFVMGRLGTGGTVSDEGILMGVEMFRSADALRGTVAHEAIHIQQRASGQWKAAEAAPSMLVVALMEGTAAFIGELISGVRGNDAAQAYGRANERAVWAEFQRQMRGTDLDGWFYGDPPGERPADLGYFVGYRIAEAYYERAADKGRAIRDLLTSPDFDGLLAGSGYQP